MCRRSCRDEPPVAIESTAGKADVWDVRRVVLSTITVEPQWDALHARLEELQQEIDHSNEPPLLQTASLTERLEQLFASAEQLGG
jgi:hypothetical protein